VVAGVITAAHFPASLQGQATQAVQQAFMTGVHHGSLVAAGATAAAALVALFLVPSRAASGAGESVSRTDAAVSRTPQVTASQA